MAIQTVWAQKVYSALVSGASYPFDPVLSEMSEAFSECYSRLLPLLVLIIANHGVAV